jgi:uncharacterized protein (TIGR00251 family)
MEKPDDGEREIVSVKVIPNAPRNEISGWRNHELLVRIASAPTDGKANEALLGLLADKLGCRKAEIGLEKGAASRHKAISIPRGSLARLGPLSSV